MPPPSSPSGGASVLSESIRADGELLRLSRALVDELGDQQRAVRLAAELAGLSGEPRVPLYEPPRSSGLFIIM